MTDEEQKKIFSNNLNKYISLSGKQQKEVAEAVGTNPSTINMWCKGNSMPGTGKIRALADYFRIGMSDLTDLKEEKEIEVAKELRSNGYNGNIIFWTSHKEYVFEALDLLPVHYIIKGSENGRMYAAFNHALEHIHKSTLMIKRKDFIHRVEFQNIEYIESRNKYIIIHCTCGMVYTERCKLSDIEELLDSRFLRCHQSYIINMDEVKEINTSFLMFSGNTVPIRRKDFAKIRNEFEEYTTFN